MEELGQCKVCVSRCSSQAHFQLITVIHYHRITRVGKDLQDHLAQQFTYHQLFPTKPHHLVQHLNVSLTPPGMVTSPPFWAAYSST